MRGPIGAVLFDFDHTLGIDHRLEQGVLRDLSARYCGQPLDNARIDALLSRFRTGSVDLATMLEEAFVGCRPPDDLTSTYKTEALSRVNGRVTAFPGCAELFAQLKARGFVTAILSNGWAELQHAKAAAIGFEGPVFVSEEIGAWKPDPVAFRYAAQGAGVDASRCIYVGDSPVADVAGAKSAGMLTVWADLEGQTYPSDVIAPDFRVTALAEILDIPSLHVR